MGNLRINETNAQNNDCSGVVEIGAELKIAIYYIIIIYKEVIILFIPILTGTNTTHTKEERLEIQYIVFMTIVVETLRILTGRNPVAFS